MTDVFGEVDIAFVLDVTGSMGHVIEEAKSQIRLILSEAAAAGDLDIRAALIWYRDHTDPCVCHTEGFGTPDDLHDQLQPLIAQGGGDEPEAVLDGLLKAAVLEWRPNADKTMWLVSDAPAHGMGVVGDAFPSGCPCRATPGGVVEIINGKGIHLNVISLPIEVLGFPEFAAACFGMHKTAGKAAETSYAFAAGVHATSSLVSASRSYAAASASLGSSEPSVVAASMGWTEEMAKGTLGYMRSRGLDPVVIDEAKVEAFKKDVEAFKKAVKKDSRKR